MACQKVAVGGVKVSEQIADPVSPDGFGRGRKIGVMGWRERAAEMKFLGAALPKNTTGNPRLYNGYL